jgi:two-component system, cell cycle sensor histidine kinase and response regulator CckA
MRTEHTHPSVMVVDDEPSVRQIVRRILEPAGYRVTEAQNGMEACAAMGRAGPPDLLISDYMMPELTGAEVARRFRVAQPDLPVLFVTGFADGLFGEKETLWDGEAFLEKPFNRNGLLEAVSLLLFGSVRHESAPDVRQLATAGGL